MVKQHGLCRCSTQVYDRQAPVTQCNLRSSSGKHFVATAVGSPVREGISTMLQVFPGRPLIKIYKPCNSTHIENLLTEVTIPAKPTWHYWNIGLRLFI